MERRRKLIFGKCAALFAAIPVLIYAFEFGPDPGHAGVPNEAGTCANSGCHGGTPNSFGGSVSVTFPNGLTYTPGVQQHLVVTISDAAQIRWGFQLTARQANDTTIQAGTFTPGPEGRTQAICTSMDLTARDSVTPCPSSLPLQYIEHTLTGYQFAQANPGKYEFEWTPPATNVGDIVVYVAGNAANGDLRNTGDHIYTATYTLSPAATDGGNPPAISQNGVVNGASFAPGIAAGSWVTIQGTNLSQTTRTWRSDEIVNGVLPTQLDGVSVTINGKPAAVSYISPTQINVQAPSDDSLGIVPVQVTNSAGPSAVTSAQLDQFSPAFFLWDGKYAVATRPDFSLAAKPGLFPGVTTVPAKPGDIIILWGTGFGPTNPPFPGGVIVTQPNELANVPVVTIGGSPVEFIGGALSPNFAGLYQIAVRIPNVANGDQPVIASFGSFQSPSNVFITVEQ